MIVQTAPEEKPHLVIIQTDHALMSGDFAAAFGNDEFEPVAPFEAMVHVAGHHDDGWAPIDDKVEMDVNTGLPYHLTQTPLPYLMMTSAGSPQANEAYDLYSGIISSMHTYGLFHGRYGLSDKIFIDLVPSEHKPAMDAILANELARQERIKGVLSGNEETAVFVTKESLFHNYKLLQFFDTLALYFHMDHKEARTDAQFLNVPRALGDDVTITIKPVGDGIYSLSPYPFKESEMSFSYQGRLMTPQPEGTDLKVLMASIDPTIETITLVRSA